MNVIISALLSKQSIPAQVLDYMIENTVILISEATYQELSEKLLQEKFDKYVTSVVRAIFLEKLRAFCEIVTVNTRIQMCRDSKDNAKFDFLIQVKKRAWRGIIEVQSK